MSFYRKIPWARTDMGLDLNSLGQNLGHYRDICLICVDGVKRLLKADESRHRNVFEGKNEKRKNVSSQSTFRDSSFGLDHRKTQIEEDDW